MADEPSNNEPTPTPATTGGRRSFLRAAAWGSGIASIGGIAGFGVRQWTTNHATPTRPALGDDFTYDVARYQTSDPALVRYEETLRFDVGLERARNLTAGDDGKIIVCGTGGIRQFSAQGTFINQITTATPIYATAVRANGDILAGQAGKITIFGPSGNELAVWDFANNFLPTSIALTDEFIYVADAGGRVVMKLDHDGKIKLLIGAKDADRNIAGFMIPSPYFCVRMAKDGLLRVTNPGEHLIEAYTSQGDRETAWGKASFAIDGFCGCCNPVSFDLFADGSYVTCEKGLPRVKLYDSHGTFVGIVAGPEAFPEYLKSANAGTPHALGSGIYVAIDRQGRVLVLDVIGGTVRIMKPKI